MRSSARRLAVAALVFLGCSSKELVDRLAPKAEVEFARTYLGALQKGDLDAIAKYAGPELQGPDAAAKIAELARYFPRGEPRSVELVGSQVFQSPATRTVRLTFQYEFEEGWLLAALVLDGKSGGAFTVRGINVQKLPDSLERLNAFTFEGKGPVHLLILGATALVLLFVLATFVICLRTRPLHRKWLWALLVLVGACAVHLNWTTGQVGFQLLTIHLLGVGATRAPYAPWILTVTFPLGAVFFLARRRRLMQRSAPVAPPVAGSPPGRQASVGPAGQAP